MKIANKFPVLIFAIALLAAGALPARAAANKYVQTDLVSDIPGLAAVTDPNLLNPWGIAFFPGQSPFWINGNNAGLSFLYDGMGVPFPGLASVIIPAPTSPTGGTPTGIIANFFVGNAAFLIPDPIHTGQNFGPALFIFDTEDGTIEAWNSAPFVMPGLPDPASAEIVVDNSAGGAATGAVYKGLALATNSLAQPLLYATNFRTGTVDVFDTNFAPVSVSGGFSDPKIQKGYSPFGIQTINNQLWVTYALQDHAKHDPINKPAHGFVDVFDADGNLIYRFAQHGHLSSPWGVAMAPASFGKFANDILIGNFGDGRINAYDPASHHWLGRLQGPKGKPLVNDGLWALIFSGSTGQTALNAPPDTLYFSAGLNHEADGLFGFITPQ
jgi:uncharacterized protein (TIGR03118 family)